MSHIFGPVPSRRLGFSLGVDVIPFKTCTFDCVYCQLGRTTRLLSERREWVSLKEILAELARKLDTNPDFITIGGSGEPTLYGRLGELIDGVKDMTQVPVAVLTNGSMLHLPEVRNELRRADLVSPSLDGGDEASFRVVNRPHPDFPFDRLIEGMVAFRSEFNGQYWLEVFVIEGITDTRDQMAKIAACAAQIRPDRVQLNTVTRPPAEQYARGVSRERLVELASVFDPPAEVIADFPYAVQHPARKVTPREVLDLIRRHPASLNDVAAGLGLSQSQAEHHIALLIGEGRIEPVRINGGICYRVPPAD